MKFPAPTRADHERFCEREGWTRVRSARGRTGSHHVTYELVLPDGRVLRTRISHPPDRSTYGPALWAHVLRDQLDVTEEVFWACVRDKVLPTRGAPPRPGTGIPADVVHHLLKRGVPERDVARMSRAEALQRLADLWASE